MTVASKTGGRGMTKGRGRISASRDEMRWDGVQVACDSCLAVSVSFSLLLAPSDLNASIDRECGWHFNNTSIQLFVVDVQLWNGADLESMHIILLLLLQRATDTLLVPYTVTVWLGLLNTVCIFATGCSIPIWTHILTHIVLQALKKLHGHVEEIPCVVGGREVFTGNIQKQVSVSSLCTKDLGFVRNCFFFTFNV